jgi:hypothetical protein
MKRQTAEARGREPTGLMSSAATPDREKRGVSASHWALDQDWRVLVTTHPNLLVVGTDVAVDDVLSTLPCTYEQCVVTCSVTVPFVLPSPPRSGTLILRDVAAVSPDGQRRLMAWLDETSGRPRVIATSARPLWPSVESGEFLDALYYRLNVVYLDLRQRPDTYRPA